VCTESYDMRTKASAARKKVDKMKTTAALIALASI
jgi:hypothetical protein